MPESWIEIKARGKAGTKDRAISLLVEAGSPGVVEEEFEAEEGVWEVPRGEKIRAGRLTAYIPEDSIHCLTALRKKLKVIGWAFTQSRYRDRDWAVLWREGFRPQRISFGKRRIVVRAPWHSIEKKKGEVVLIINPSMAFGTGSHPTTRMCLKTLLMLVGDKKVPAPSSFLDVGTGSGILAIAAKKLGFRKSIGIDIDRTAVTVARKTAKLNRVSVTISPKTLEEVRGTFSVVAANIRSGELKRLRPLLASKVKQGGFLILSGLLREEVPLVVELYTKNLNFKFLRKYVSGEWGTVVLEKTGGSFL